MTRTVDIIGAPTDYGANRRGVDMGPSAIRYAGLADQLEAAGVDPRDAGDVTAPNAEEREPEKTVPTEGKAKFLHEVEEVSRNLTERVTTSLDDGRFPLVLGGDHSVAIGTIMGSARDAEIGAIWFDAHGDFNTPRTTPSGNVHGMPLAAVLGKDNFQGSDWAHAPNLREENVAIVGLRSVDETETDAIENSDVSTFTMSDIDQRGLSDVVREAIDIASRGVDGVHVSLDLDWLDPNEAPGVGTPVRGGVTYREAHAAMELLARRDEEEGILRSFEVVEVNPILDSHNGTAETATELAASAFGKRIL